MTEIMNRVAAARTGRCLSAQAPLEHTARISRAALIRSIAMSELHRITVNSEQLGGRPCIRGLRLRVKDVLDLLASGASREEILADYPYLEPADITAALEFAAMQSDHPVLRAA
jgi:uncharacterized protein (DUF433 family)